MKDIMALLNGTRIHYHVIDAAIAACKIHQTKLHVIMLDSEKVERTGYIFPSDITLAETLTSEEDILEDDRKILFDYIRLIQQESLAEKVYTTVTIQTGLTKETLKKLTATAQLLYVDAEMDNDKIGGDENLSLRDIKAHADCPVMLINHV